MAGDDSLVKVENLYMYFPVTAGVMRKRVGDVKAVDGVSFDIKKGSPCYPEFNRLDPVTRYPVPSANLSPFWHLLLADVNRHLTSGMEGAAAGGIDRAGDITS